MSIQLRHAVQEDIPRLAALNRAAYPELVAEGVVYDASQLKAQLSVFPEGQHVAEIDGHIVGAISTLVVSEEDALMPHTWIGITGYGCFGSHRADGNVLYLADVYVDPSAQNRGVGSALYRELFAICGRRRLRRTVAGGRLWGYHAVAHEITALDYVREIEQGIRRDRVLSSQLRAGFRVRGILSNYLDDWRSGNFATLLEWPNPDFASVGHSLNERTLPVSA